MDFGKRIIYSRKEAKKSRMAKRERRNLWHRIQLGEILSKLKVQDVDGIGIYYRRGKIRLMFVFSLI